MTADDEQSAWVIVTKAETSLAAEASAAEGIRQGLDDLSNCGRRLKATRLGRRTLTCNWQTRQEGRIGVPPA